VQPWGDTLRWDTCSVPGERGVSVNALYAHLGLDAGCLLLEILLPCRLVETHKLVALALVLGKEFVVLVALQPILDVHLFVVLAAYLVGDPGLVDGILIDQVL